MQPKARREIVLLCAISAVVLAPLLFLGLRSVSGPRPASPTASSFTLRPVIPRLANADDSHPENTPGTRSYRLSYASGRAFLSPDGRLVARMEPPPASAGTAAPVASASRDLVLRSSSSGKEVFREVAQGQFVAWIPQSSAFVMRDGLDIAVFSRAIRKAGSPAPLQPWTSTVVSLPPSSDLISNTGNSSTPSGFGDSHLQDGAIGFSPDFRYAVKASWPQGEIFWSVADLATGKIAPPVKVGRWLRYNPRVGYDSNDVSISVAPGNVAPGAAPVVALLQTTEVEPLVAPTPRPTSTPTPLPTATPTPSPAQAEFLDRAKREENAVQTLVEKVLGIDGAEPEVTDETEVARIEAEVKRRNLALRIERERLFPMPIYPTPTRPAIKLVSLSDAKPFQIECFDLRRRKRLWSAPIRAQYRNPHLQFSPDGKALVAWGTARVRSFPNSAYLSNDGIEFFDVFQGRKRASFRLQEHDFGSDGDEVKFFWDSSQSSPAKAHAMAATLDRFTKRIQGPGTNFQNRIMPRLRLFDTTTARETGYIDIDTQRFEPYFQNQLRDFSCDDIGLFWLLGEADYAVLSRSQLGTEKLGPPPRPTPMATRRPT